MITGRGWVCTTSPAVHSGQPSSPNVEGALDHERTTRDHKPPAAKDDRNAKGVDGERVPANHLQTADKSGWDKIGQARLTTEGLRQWEMHAHVDHVFDLVPFWQRGIDAAEKGEVLRMEEFLEKMEGDGGWRTANEVLGMLGGEWGGRNQGDWAASQRGAWEPNAFGWAASQRGGWGVGSTHVASDATESSHRRDGGWGVREEWAMGESDLKMGRGKQERPRIQMARAVGSGSGGREELRHFVDAIARQEAVNDERRKQMHLFFEMPMEQKIQKIQDTIRFLRAHG